MEFKADPVAVFWDHASLWRKLRLLRMVGALKSPTAEKYVREMYDLRKKDGGFSRGPGEVSTVSATGEAILDLTVLHKKSPMIAGGVKFLWALQNSNGGWHENPNLPKDAVPFWSSTEKGVPILTADCIEAAVEAGYGEDAHTIGGVEWLKTMQSASGMWLSLEGADPSDSDPDSTQRAISALIRYGMPRSSEPIRRGCTALEHFVLEEAGDWAMTHPPMWPWTAALEGLVAAGYDASFKASHLALGHILRLRQEDGSRPNQYEIRVVPVLIALRLMSTDSVLATIREREP
ncbi:MAG TPA: hypothetical protein VEY12_07910 [Thermoplasmata archaeon]|nr:hypothetical protein [Thermoplasmata archaeon]